MKRALSGFFVLLSNLLLAGGNISMTIEFNGTLSSGKISWFSLTLENNNNLDVRFLKPNAKISGSFSIKSVTLSHSLNFTRTFPLEELLASFTRLGVAGQSKPDNRRFQRHESGKRLRPEPLHLQNGPSSHQLELL